MNKGEFVEALSDRLDLSRAQADRAVSGVLDIITEELAKGGKIAFRFLRSVQARCAHRPQPADRRQHQDRRIQRAQVFRWRVTESSRKR